MGIQFNLDNTLNNIIYLLILMLILYLIFKYGLRRIVEKILNKKYSTIAKTNETEAYKIALNKQILDNLEKLNSKKNDYPFY